MGRLTGVLGIVTVLLFAYLLSTNRRAIRLQTVVIGLAMQFVFACWFCAWAGASGCSQSSAMRLHGCWVIVCGLGNCLWSAGQQGVEIRFLFCLPGAAHHHLHRGVLRHSLSLRGHAVRRPATGEGHDALHGSQRRRVTGRRRQHLHGTDGGAADGQPVSGDGDDVRIDGHHDRRHGAYFRRRDGRLHRLWHRSAASAGGGHHDGARDAPDRQDAGTGDREADHRRNHQAGGCRVREQRQQRARRCRQGHHGRAPSRAQRRGDADCVSGADRVDRRHSRRRPQFPRGAWTCRGSPRSWRRSLG